MTHEPTVYRCSHRPDGHLLPCATPSCPSGTMGKYFYAKVDGAKSATDRSIVRHRVRHARVMAEQPDGTFEWRWVPAIFDRRKE